MIASAASRERVPSASAVSASPSRWSAPVSSAPTARAAPAATSGGTIRASPYAVPPTAAPTPAPTTGKSAAPVRGSNEAPPTGIRVRNATAASSGLATRIGDAGLVEARHVVEERDRAAHDRQRERGAAALTEAEAQVEERLEPEPLEDERMPRLRRAVPGDHRLDGRGVDRRRDERRRAGDEAVEHDGDARGAAAEHHPGEQRDLEAA